MLMSFILYSAIHFLCVTWTPTILFFISLLGTAIGICNWQIWLSWTQYQPLTWWFVTTSHLLDLTICTWNLAHRFPSVVFADLCGIPFHQEGLWKLMIHTSVPPLAILSVSYLEREFLGNFTNLEIGISKVIITGHHHFSNSSSIVVSFTFQQ